MLDFPWSSDLGLDRAQVPGQFWEAQYARLERYHRYYSGRVFEATVPDEDRDLDGDPPLLYPIGMNLVKMLCVAQADSLWGEYEGQTLRFKARAAGYRDGETPTGLERARLLGARCEGFFLDNDMDSLLWEAGLDQQWSGGVAFKVAPDLGKPNRIRLEKISPFAFFPVWDPEDRERLLEVYVVLEIPGRQAELKYGVRTDKATVYRVEHWTETLYENSVDGKRVDQYSGANPWRVVPFVYIPRLRASGQLFGDALTEDVMAAQDELNMRVADNGEGPNYNAHPTRWGRNMKVAFDRKNFSVGPDALWDLGQAIGDEKPEVGVLAAYQTQEWEMRDPDEARPEDEQGRNRPIPLDERAELGKGRALLEQAAGLQKRQAVQGASGSTRQVVAELGLSPEQAAQLEASGDMDRLRGVSRRLPGEFPTAEAEMQFLAAIRYAEQDPDVDLYLNKRMKARRPEGERLASAFTERSVEQAARGPLAEDTMARAVFLTRLARAREYAVSQAEGGRMSFVYTGKEGDQFKVVQDRGENEGVERLLDLEGMAVLRTAGLLWFDDPRERREFERENREGLSLFDFYARFASKKRPVSLANPALPGEEFPAYISRAEAEVLEGLRSIPATDAQRIAAGLRRPLRPSRVPGGPISLAPKTFNMPLGWDHPDWDKLVYLVRSAGGEVNAPEEIAYAPTGAPEPDDIKAQRDLFATITALGDSAYMAQESPSRFLTQAVQPMFLGGALGRTSGMQEPRVYDRLQEETGRAESLAPGGAESLASELQDIDTRLAASPNDARLQLERARKLRQIDRFRETLKSGVATGRRAKRLAVSDITWMERIITPDQLREMRGKVINDYVNARAALSQAAPGTPEHAAAGTMKKLAGEKWHAFRQLSSEYWGSMRNLSDTSLSLERGIPLAQEAIESLDEIAPTDQVKAAMELLARTESTGLGADYTRLAERLPDANATRETLRAATTSLSGLPMRGVLGSSREMHVALSLMVNRRVQGLQFAFPAGTTAPGLLQNLETARAGGTPQQISDAVDQVVLMGRHLKDVNGSLKAMKGHLDDLMNPVGGVKGAEEQVAALGEDMAALRTRRAAATDPATRRALAYSVASARSLRGTYAGLLDEYRRVQGLEERLSASDADVQAYTEAMGAGTTAQERAEAETRLDLRPQRTRGGLWGAMGNMGQMLYGLYMARRFYGWTIGGEQQEVERFYAPREALLQQAAGQGPTGVVASTGPAPSTTSSSTWTQHRPWAWQPPN